LRKVVGILRPGATSILDSEARHFYFRFDRKHAKARRFKFSNNNKTAIFDFPKPDTASSWVADERLKIFWNPKIDDKTSNCWLSGRRVLLFHEQTEDVAIPIFAAIWPRVRFFSSRLTLKQSPAVFMFNLNTLACF